MVSLAHIINPVKVKQSSDLFYAQPITFQSMLNANDFAKNHPIELFTTQYEEDAEIIPEGFTVLPNLKQSVLDVNSNLSKRKLPLINDILQQLDKNSSSDYFIYTNADIGLMPQFYKTVLHYIEQGNDALVINRRRLNSNYTKVTDLPLIYSDFGKSHPGFDCFVFKKELFQRMVLGKICVGIPFIGVAMAHNLFCLAENPLFLPEAHLTFHIGEAVLPTRDNEFYKHNRKEFEEVVYPALKENFDIDKFPYANLPFYEKALKWMLNPSLFTKDFLQQESNSFKAKLDELRWRILQK